MRHLIILGLALGVVGAASAQTEVIIRRPGEKDQVIRLDEARAGEAAARINDEIRRVMPMAMKQQEAARLQGVAVAGQLSALRNSTDAMGRLEELRATDGVRISAEAAIAGPMARTLAAVGRLANMRRTPHLGVVLDYGPRATDKYGAYVTAVTPGSPAERAGVLSGDVITRLAGKSLAVKERSNDEDSSPGVKLTQILAQLAPNKSVELELRRGTQTRTVRITPEEDTAVVTSRSGPALQLFERTMPGRVSFAAPEVATMNVFGNEGFGNGGSFSYSFNSNGMFANLELAPVNEKLGAYFGTSEGVLVVNTGSTHAMFIRRTLGDSTHRTADRARYDDTVAATYDGKGNQVRANGNTLGLEPGDVIVSVDGRKVGTPSQLMRIVATYDHGEEFKLQIMRQKHAETLTAKMP